MVSAVSAAGAGPAVNASKISAQIVALQKQSNALMKQSQGLQKTMATMQDGDAKDALQKQLMELSHEIQMIQQQIAQLQQQAAKAGQDNSIVEAAGGPSAAKTKAQVVSSGNPMIGSNVDIEV